MGICRNEGRRDRIAWILRVPDLNLAGSGHFYSARPSDRNLGK